MARVGRPATVWGPDRLTQLRRLWDEGVSCDEIGRRLGVSSASVSSKALRLGLRRDARPASPEEQHTAREARKKRLLELWALGASDQEMAEELGVTHYTIRNYRVELDLRRASKAGPGRPKTNPKAKENYTKPHIGCSPCMPMPAPWTLEKKRRSCLMCGVSYVSLHAGDRICEDCRSSAAWRCGGVRLAGRPG